MSFDALLDADDIAELDKIKNIAVKNIVKQLKTNGVAITNDERWSRVISKRYPELRKPESPMFLMGGDKRTGNHFIVFNHPVYDEQALAKGLKKIIKGFGYKDSWR